MTHQAIFIIRGFNKSEQDFLDLEQRFLPILDACKKYDIVPRIIYSTPDTADIRTTSTLPIATMYVSNPENAPFWTIGLNEPITQLLTETSLIKTTSIIPFSFETHLDEKNATLLAETISNRKRFLACRITPDWLNENNPYSVATQDDVVQRWNYVKTNVSNESLSNILRDEKRLQTLCLFGRNTLAHYYLSDFQTYGLFDETTDALGGMEDWEYLLRIAPNIESFEHVIFYSDIRIKEDEQDEMAIKKQREKLTREINALKKIIERKI